MLNNLPLPNEANWLNEGKNEERLPLRRCKWKTVASERLTCSRWLRATWLLHFSIAWVCLGEIIVRRMNILDFWFNMFQCEFLCRACRCIECNSSVNVSICEWIVASGTKALLSSHCKIWFHTGGVGINAGCVKLFHIVTVVLSYETWTMAWNENKKSYECSVSKSGKDNMVEW